MTVKSEAGLAASLGLIKVSIKSLPLTSLQGCSQVRMYVFVCMILIAVG